MWSVDWSTRAVSLARVFSRAADRAEIVDGYPPSLVELYDVVVAHPDWQRAATLADRAFVVVLTLDQDDDLAERVDTDGAAAAVAFDPLDAEAHAAIREIEEAFAPRSAQNPAALPVPGTDDGLLGGEVVEGGGGSWIPHLPIEDWSPPAAASPAESIPAQPPEPLSVQPDAEPAEPVTPTSEETIGTWLNAELTGDRPLRVGTASALALSYGEQSPTAIATARAEIPIAADEESIDVTVHLSSSDFTVSPFPQFLRIGRDGRSINRALFDIVPLHDGPSVLCVLVDVTGNFLQRLDITFDVGADLAPDTTTYGRPAAGGAVLGERLATLQFLPAAGGYQLIATAVSPDPIMVRITPVELARRIADIRAVLLRAVSDRQVALNLDLPKERTDYLLRELSFEGFRLYQAIFAAPAASADLKAVGKWLRETLRDTTTTLQVASSGFPVPWALMYLTDRYEASPLTWENFIGMRHVVEQIPMIDIDAVPPAPTIASTPDLGVRVIYNEGIDDTMPSRPIAAQRAYWGSRGVTLTEGTKAEDLVRIALAPSATDKVLYLYCHAVSSPDDPDDSHLILSGDQSVTLGYLSAIAPIEDALPAHPLVFINACESGDLSPNFYDGFVPYFLAKGARGVIGTECKTPGLFASEWSKTFFDEMFAGRALGAVVLDLRRRFLTEHNNPLGLLYGVHCNVDTRIDPALATGHVRKGSTP